MPRSLQPVSTTSIQTVIFVDIDGVLNVGVRDDIGGAPLLLSRSNIEQANKVSAKRSPSTQICVDKILAACQRPIGQHDHGTFSTLAAHGDLQLSDVLVGRLALLIKAAEAKGRTSVVLSSSWRHPKHVNRVQILERNMEKHLGHGFSFSARTEQFSEKVPDDRIRVIGNFVASMPVTTGEHLRIVVLDDFFSHPIDSVPALEKCLQMRIPSETVPDVKIVHTFEEWTSPRGLLMQVGVGLTYTHLQDCLDFIEKDITMHCGEDDLSSDSLLSSDSKQDSGEDSEGSASTAATFNTSPTGRQRKSEGPTILDVKERHVVDEDAIIYFKSPPGGSPVSVKNQQEMRRLHWMERVANALPWVTGFSF